MPKKTDITRRRGERGDSEAVKKYLAEIGRRGGAAGKGAAKRRGNSEYYRGIRRKRSRGPSIRRNGYSGTGRKGKPADAEAAMAGK